MMRVQTLPYTLTELTQLFYPLRGMTLYHVIQQLAHSNVSSELRLASSFAYMFAPWSHNDRNDDCVKFKLVPKQDLAPHEKSIYWTLDQLKKRFTTPIQQSRIHIVDADGYTVVALLYYETTCTWDSLNINEVSSSVLLNMSTEEG